MKISVTIYLVSVFSFATIAVAQERANMNEITDYRGMLRAPSETERIAGKDKILGLRKQIIDQMVLILNDPVDQGEEWLNPATSRNIALSILGEMRSEEAVPHIIKWLRPQDGQVVIEDRSVRFSPAANALVKIGKPAVPALIALIEVEGDEYSQKGCLSTLLSEIEGQECAELILTKVLTSQSNAQRKQRIESALMKVKEP